MNDMKTVMLELARGAGQVMMKYYGRIEDYEEKTSEIDIVTVADKEAEAFIVGGLRDSFPDHGIIAEESSEEKPRDEEYVWIIDPVDGTTNYAHGYPAFCVSIGLQKNRKSVLGAVYDPLRGELFQAERGGGAFLNGEPIRVSRVRSLSRSLLITGFPYNRRASVEDFLRYFKAFMMRCHGLRRVGSAALDLCNVACGRAEGYFEAGLKPWDTAAAWLILEEAGGRMSDYSGGEFDVFKKETLATNGLVHDQILEVMNEVRAGVEA